MSIELKPISTSAMHPTQLLPDLGSFEKAMQDASARIIQSAQEQAKAIINASTPRTVIAEIKIGELPAIKLDGTETVHKSALSIMQLVAHDIKPYLYGPRGCGKTEIVRQVAKALDAKLMIISCNETLDVDTLLFGKREITNGSTSVSPSEFEAMFSDTSEQYKIFFFDEVAALHNNSSIKFNAPISNGVYYNELTQKTVTVGKKVRFIAADNTNGLGGTEAFTGRNRLDSAFRGRFPATIKIDYDLDIFKAIMTQHSTTSDLLIPFAEGIVKLQEKRSSYTIDYRMANTAVKLASLGWQKKEILNAVLGEMPESVRKDIGL